jgi:flagellar biosynthesis protein FlhB
MSFTDQDDTEKTEDPTPHDRQCAEGRGRHHQPDHYSVALQYERGMAAPICVAKGTEASALKIREVAAKHNIPLAENPAARPRVARHRRGRRGYTARAL